MALVMSMGITALAAEGDVKLSVKDPVDGHTYKYLQLFVGDLSTDKTTLSNVKWGANVATSITYKEKANAVASTFTEEKTLSPKVGDAVPQAVLDYLASLKSDELATANTISAWVTGDGTEISANGVDVAKGYYVIKDSYKDANATQTTTLSTNVVQIVGPTEISPKAGETSHKKEVLDVNDSTEAAINLDNLFGVESWVKSADHDFGDKVPFKLTTKIGTDFAKYDSYYLAVSDTLGTGLSLDQDSIKVYVDGELATKGDADGNYTLTVSGQTFKVEFKKLNGNTKAAAGKDVVIVYTATLGEGAVIGNPGTPNTSYAEFSNNPNDEQTGKGKTPTDTVVVFTYKADVDKVDPDGAALSGAGFTLYKKYNAAVSGREDNVAGATPAGALSTTFPSGEFWYPVKTISTGTTFTFEGIDDGTYVLVESTTPNGYNTIDPITLTVTATHAADAESTTGYSVSAITTGNDNFKADAKGGEIKFTKKDKTEKTLTTGEIYSEIVNNKGTVLPSTGGIGTTIFYVVGSIMVIAAGVLLVTKKRMGREG